MHASLYICKNIYTCKTYIYAKTHTYTCVHTCTHIHTYIHKEKEYRPQPKSLAQTQVVRTHTPRCFPYVMTL